MLSANAIAAIAGDAARSPTLRAFPGTFVTVG